jgi:hypothetical protein
MLGQTFAPSDLASVAALVLLETLLSADNALVLAMMVRHLKPADRQRALLYGLGGAFVFRLIAIVFAGLVLQQWWLQAIGAAYLLYLPLKHFVSHHQGQEKTVKQGSFWATVVAVEVTDIAFALDSVLAGIGFITSAEKGIQEDKLWVVYLGALIGIVLLRIAAGAFVRLLERFPALDHVAYLLVGWVGIKLGFHASEKAHEAHWLPFAVPHLTELVFWAGLGTIVLVGGMYAYLKPAKEGSVDEAEVGMLEDAQDLTTNNPVAESAVDLPTQD